MGGCSAAAKRQSTAASVAAYGGASPSLWRPLLLEC